MLEYLGRYTHRVAISNRRILKSVADSRVLTRIFSSPRQRHELAIDLGATDELTETGMYRLLVEQTVGTQGGQPWAVLTGLYTFDQSLADVELLGRVAKVAENSLDYSVQNTTRQALFLVTSRVEKYVGKTVVDTLFVRLGDVLSAVVVWTGTLLALPTAAFAALNLVLIGTWIAVAGISVTSPTATAATMRSHFGSAWRCVRTWRPIRSCWATARWSCCGSSRWRLFEQATRWPSSVRRANSKSSN